MEDIAVMKIPPASSNRGDAMNALTFTFVNVLEVIKSAGNDFEYCATTLLRVVFAVVSVLNELSNAALYLLKLVMASGKSYLLTK